MTSPDQFGPADTGSQQPQRNPSLRNVPSAIRRYGLAAIFVALALIAALLLQRYKFHNAVLSLFLFAIAVTAWYVGVGPAALSIVLSALCFLYFFAPPIYSFAFTVADLPAIVILVSFGVLIATFSVVRRRIERQLLRARDELQADIDERQKAETKLRRSEAYLAEAQKLSHTGSWAWSPVTSESLYWSEEMFRIFGFDPQQGPPSTETFWERVHSEDRKSMYELIRNAVLEKREYTHEHRIVLPEGTVKHLHAVGRPLLEDGEVVEYIGTLVDVTDRKRAEEARQELEEQWRAAFDSNPTMYFIVDAAGRIVSVNIFGAEQLGYSVRELVGQLVWNVFYEPDRDAVRRHAKECFKQPGQMMRWEARKMHKDGTMLWVRETANAVVLKKRPVLLVACENITEQKRAQEALRRSERELRDLIETMPSPAFSTLPDGTSGFTTGRWREYSGLSTEETFGERGASAIHPDDRDLHLGKWRASLASGEPFENEARHRSANGEYRWFLVRAVPLRGEQGNILKWYGILTDIEDRKRAEEALRRSEAYLAEAQRLTHTGSWAWNPVADKVIYWSDEMFRILGFDPQKGIPPGPEFGQRVHPEDHDSVFEYIRDSVSQKRDYLVNHKIVLPNGTVRHIETIGHPVVNSSGEVVEYVGTAVDITERKLAEAERERLRQMESDLARVNRVSMMGELAASLAHEIKQPIAAAATNAKTSLRWLQREVPDIDEAREALSRIVKDVHRAADIIDRNRALYRRGTPNREIVNLNELIREMIALLHDAANRNAVSIRAELDGAIPTITADRVQILQVLMNLMLNGIEAMKGTGGELTISSTKNEDGQVVLSVSDLGVGLPIGKIDQIFDAFFTTKTQGTGMGLSISRRIVESHGGRLWAAGNPDRGATFHFSLPASIPSSTESAVVEENHGLDN